MSSIAPSTQFPHHDDDAERTFERRRAQIIRALELPGANVVALRNELDDLYIERRLTLATSNANEDQQTASTPTDELRTLIVAMMEDGLLRYSRRQRILEEARQRGIDEFHAQLLIAQVQMGSNAAFDVPHTNSIHRDWATNYLRATTIGLVVVATVLLAAF